jgi:hypothetical protein
VRPRTLIWCALAFAATAFSQEVFAPWPDARFEKARIREVASEELYDGGSPGLRWKLPLTLLLLDETNWTEARALRQLRKTAKIFAACEIELDGVLLARGRGPGGRHDINMAALYPKSDLPADVVDLSRLIPSGAPWPRAFFVGQLLGDEVLARAYQQGDVSDEEARRFPYMNTAWIAYRAYWEGRTAEYSPLAHELAHVLCRCAHTGGDRRHLLHEKRNFLGALVLEQDCRKMRLSPLLAVVTNDATSISGFSITH